MAGRSKTRKRAGGSSRRASAGSGEASAGAGEAAARRGAEAAGGEASAGAGTSAAPEILGAAAVTAPEQEAPASPENAQLEAELAAALAGAPEEAPAPGQAVEPQPAVDPIEAWRPFIAGGVVPLTANLILPQWDLTDAEQREVAEALSCCLAQLFPDGLEGKYACWFRLVAAAGGIVVTRYVQGGGTLPGIGPPKPKAAEKPAPKREGGGGGEVA
jgi:hypothetical protein